MNKTDEKKNRDLFLWFNPDGCYHKPETGSLWCNLCKKAHRGGVDYATESGFFALLEGLRAKGWFVDLIIDNRAFYAELGLFKPRAEPVEVKDSADSLPMALREAAVAAMSAEKTK